MSDTTITVLEPAVKYNITTKPQSASYSAWAKAGLVFGTSVGVFALTKATGALSWVSGLFDGNNAEVHDDAMVLQAEQTKVVTLGQASVVDMHDVQVGNNDGIGAVEFEELKLPRAVGKNARRDAPNINQETLVGAPYNFIINTTELFGGPVSQAYVSLQGGGQLPNWLNATIKTSLTGSYTTFDGAYKVVISGHMAYVGELWTWNGLEIIDVSNPASPVLKGNYTTLSSPNWVAVSKNMTYVAVKDGGWNVLEIIDVSNPASPVLKGNYTTSGSPNGVVISGNMAYVAESGNWDGLQIIDVSNPTSPVLKGSYATSGGANRVAINGNMAYLTNNNMLQIINVSDSSSPVLKGNCVISSGVNGVAISGNMAYMAGSELQIIDVSNSSSPVLKGSYAISGEATGVAISGNMAYISVYCNGCWNGLQIIDVSNPASPVLKGSHDTYSWALGIAINGNIAYLANNNMLQIIDIGTMWQLRGTPKFTDVGTINIEVTAINSTGNVLSKGIVLEVEPNLVLCNNILNINQGQTVNITNVNLSAADVSVNNSTLVFIASNVQYGNFYLDGMPTTTFVQQNITDGKVAFITDGSASSPSYMVSVSNGATTTTKIPANITFKMLLNLVNNTLIIAQGQTVNITGVNLSTYYLNGNNANLIFTVSGVQHGNFTLKQTPTNTFTQQNITNNLVAFVTDSSANAPSYMVSVSDGATLVTVPIGANITFDVAPVLVNNWLTVNTGQTVTLSNANLKATDVNSNNATLIFTISGAQHGYFVLNGVSATSFIQQDIINSVVLFVADQSGTAPSYMVSVSDGFVSTTPANATIYFNSANTPIDSQSSSDSVGGIIGGTVGGSALLLGAAFGIYKYKKRQAEQNEGVDISMHSLRSTRDIKSDDPLIQAFLSHLDLNPKLLISNDRLNCEEKKIGGGGSGSVYKALMDQTTQVVVKVLNGTEFLCNKSWEELDEESQYNVKEFCNEVNIMSQLSHNNIVQFFGAGIQSGKFCIIMKYVSGGSLRNLLDKDREKGGILSLTSRFEMIYGASAGLHYLHLMKIIHRDIKSANFLVEVIANTDGSLGYVVKVADLGLSKDTNKHTMSTLTSIGTPGWMAPELFDKADGHCGFPSDVYAYAIVIWEVLTELDPYADIKGGMWNIVKFVMDKGRPTIPDAISNVWKALMECCWEQDLHQRPSMDNVITYCNNHKEELRGQLSSITTLEQYKQELLGVKPASKNMPAAANYTAGSSSVQPLLFSDRQSVGTSAQDGTANVRVITPSASPKVKSMQI